MSELRLIGQSGLCQENHSQYGEGGILLTLFSQLGIDSGYFCGVWRLGWPAFVQYVCLVRARLDGMLHRGRSGSIPGPTEKYYSSGYGPGMRLRDGARRQWYWKHTCAPPASRSRPGLIVN